MKKPIPQFGIVAKNQIIRGSCTVCVEQAPIDVSLEIMETWAVAHAGLTDHETLVTDATSTFYGPLEQVTPDC